MTTIRFIEHGGREHIVDANEGQSLMRAANDHGVPGILADCGGFLSCATCHVYIHGESAGLVPPATDNERSMLELAVDPTEFSRLSCQITVGPEMDGLVVNIPERQF